MFEIVKTQQLTALKRQGGDAQTVAGRERDIWQFKGHPYGRDPLAGLQTIPSIGQEDLKQFLRDYFVPSNMVAAIAGVMMAPVTQVDTGMSAFGIKAF